MLKVDPCINLFDLHTAHNPFLLGFDIQEAVIEDGKGGKLI